MEMSSFLFGLYKLLKYLVYPFTWLCLLLGILTLLAYLPASPQRLRWVRLLATSACLIVLILASPLVGAMLLGLIEQQADPPDPTTSRRFDAIVVLGGGVMPEGTLRPRTELTTSSTRRTTCGADLFQQGWAPRLLLTGGDASVFGRGPKESLEMKRLARHLGVPTEAILVETRSRNTYENAVETKRILNEASVLVVSDASHLPRAVALFRKQGLHATGYPCGYAVQNRPGDVWDGNPFDLIPGIDALAASTNAINELVGTLVYWVVGKL